MMITAIQCDMSRIMLVTVSHDGVLARPPTNIQLSIRVDHTQACQPTSHTLTNIISGSLSLQVAITDTIFALENAYKANV